MTDLNVNDWVHDQATRLNGQITSIHKNGSVRVAFWERGVAAIIEPDVAAANLTKIAVGQSIPPEKLET